MLEFEDISTWTTLFECGRPSNFINVVIAAVRSIPIGQKSEKTGHVGRWILLFESESGFIQEFSPKTIVSSLETIMSSSAVSVNRYGSPERLLKSWRLRCWWGERLDMLQRSRLECRDVSQSWSDNMIWKASRTKDYVKQMVSRFTSDTWRCLRLKSFLYWLSLLVEWCLQAKAVNDGLHKVSSRRSMARHLVLRTTASNREGQAIGFLAKMMKNESL